MKKNIKILLCLLSVGATASSYATSQWVYFFSGGAGDELASSKSQDIRLADTPAPGLTNRFQTPMDSNPSFMAGTGFGYQYHHVIFGLQGFMINTPHNYSKGIVHPQINVSPNFDTLAYHYKLKNYGVLADFSWSWQFTPALSSYFDAGLGVVWNRMYDYYETPTVGSTAAPMLSPFRNRTQAAMAYTAGTGLQIPTHGILLRIGYEFLYLNHARLSTNTIQSSSNVLKTGPLFVNMATLSVIL